jgi:hypothetical protein
MRGVQESRRETGPGLRTKAGASDTEAERHGFLAQPSSDQGEDNNNEQCLIPKPDAAPLGEFSPEGPRGFLMDEQKKPAL